MKTNYKFILFYYVVQHITLFNSFTIIISDYIINISLDTIFFCNLSSTIITHNSNNFLDYIFPASLVLSTRFSSWRNCLPARLHGQGLSHCDSLLLMWTWIVFVAMWWTPMLLVDTDAVGGHLNKTFIGSETYSLCLQFHLYNFHVKKMFYL